MSISDLQIDTSIVTSKSNLSIVSDMCHIQPFTNLAKYLESTFSPMTIDMYEHLDNAPFLNRLLNSQYKNVGNTVPVEFIEQKMFEEDPRYYEQIIFDTKQIPTRSNPHDFFNGLIWCQFPITKQILNANHIKEIISCGSTNRNSTRDKLTHFDECGIVLFTTQMKLEGQLRNHQWQDLFVGNTAKWHKKTLPIIFGHALWEMLLNPFIGLTAKALVINVSEEVMKDLQASIYTKHFYADCDQILSQFIHSEKVLELKKPWSPLPLLGVPNWSPFEQTQSFYDNQQYFMPKRQKSLI